MYIKFKLSNTGFLFLFCLCVVPATSQSFTVQYRYDTLGIDDILQVDFTIKNLDGKFIPPKFDDFTVASGPNTSSQFSMINGVTDQIKTYSYILIPNKTGDIIIPSALLVQDDLEYKTETASIHVFSRDEKRKSSKKENMPSNTIDQLPKPTKKRVLKKI